MNAALTRTLLRVPGRHTEAGGHSFPLGATICEGGVNFSVFSRHASGVDLLLFDREDYARPERVVRIYPVTQHTYHYWHTFVPRLESGQLYGYRVDGPYDPARGLRFDPAKVLLDPYGRGVEALNFELPSPRQGAPWRRWDRYCPQFAPGHRALAVGAGDRGLLVSRRTALRGRVAGIRGEKGAGHE